MFIVYKFPKKKNENKNALRKDRYRSSHRSFSIKRCVVKNFATFTGKQLCRNLSLGLQLY